MSGRLSRRERRERIHQRSRQKIFGTQQRPRLCVYRSLKHMYAQLVDDAGGRTLLTVSTLKLDGKPKKAGNIQSAKRVGEAIARQALEKGIQEVVFDRSGYLYHGRVKALAEAARGAGLKF